MKVEFTNEFKQLNLNKYPYSVVAILLYILTLEIKNQRFKLKICTTYPKLGMSEPTLVTALKKLREIGIIEREGQSDYLLNSKYIKHEHFTN